MHLSRASTTKYLIIKQIAFFIETSQNTWWLSKQGRSFLLLQFPMVPVSFFKSKQDPLKSDVTSNIK